MSHKLYIWSLMNFICFSAANHFKNFDDSILFSLDWPGYGSKPELLGSPDYEKLRLVSADQEEFQCHFPISYGEVEDGSQSYKGPQALSLLMPALRQKSCSYKIESYWSYEVCHGGKIVQYHKEQENRGKKVIDQQYTLGRITPAQLQQLEADAKAEDAASSPTAREVSETKVEGTDVPYYPIRYADGSICELTGKPRVTDVLYVCYEHGRHDVYSVKETATCEYEIIVLTDVLCQHPLYTKKEKPEIPIHCVPTAAGARRPKELLRIEAHSLKLKTMPETKLSGSPESGAMALGKIDADLANVPATLLDENHDDQETDDDEDDDDDDESGDGFDKETSSSRNSKPFPPRPLTRDQSAVKSFLTGENCLDGGIGWWHYEFCYGRHVTQFHENKDGSRITILLGTFSAPKHIEWIKKHPKKAPNAYQVTHLYSDGAVCDVTGKPRVTEVRLKCYPPSQSLGVGTVAMYLIEPQPCHYILGVETGLVCDLLHDADEYGLLQHEIFDQTQLLGEDLLESPADDGAEDDGDGDVLPGAPEPPHTEPRRDETSSKPSADEESRGGPDTGGLEVETASLNADPLNPNADFGNLNVKASHPNAEATRTNTEAANSNVEAANPNVEAANPNVEAANPNADAVNPNADAANPNAEAANSNADAANSNADAVNPNADAANPNEDSTRLEDDSTNARTRPASSRLHEDTSIPDEDQIKEKNSVKSDEL